MSEVGKVPAPLLPNLWPEITRILQEKGKAWLEIVELEELFQLSMQGLVDVWACVDDDEIEAVCFCMWEKHSKKSFYHIMWAAGEGREKYVKQGLEKIEHYACLCGATSVEFGGRMGWQRLLRPMGYVPKMRLSKNVETCWRN